MERGVRDGVLEDAVARRPRLLVLLGEPAVGRSRLRAKAGALAVERSARVGPVRAVESERHITAAAASLVVASLSDVLGDLDPSSSAVPRATLRGTVDGELVRSGRTDEARARGGGPGPARRAARPLARAYAEQVRAHTGPDDEADDHARAASTWNQKGTQAFDHARTRLEHAQWPRRHRRRSDAVDQLLTALAAFERRGCAPRGDPLPRRVARDRCGHDADPCYDAVAVPTAQEKQVAEAAAAGLTNAAVAHRMHLSPQTVEVRVTHVYRKLDISGRTELPRLLSPRDPGTAG